jgi:hypothetical protein
MYVGENGRAIVKMTSYNNLSFILLYFIEILGFKK